jgi:chromosome segregation ATPase
MDHDASEASILAQQLLENDEQSLVPEDLDLDGINLSEDGPMKEAPVLPKVERIKKKKPEPDDMSDEQDRGIVRDFKEISGAYSGEMERLQATLSNLRTDREELLTKIQKMDEERILQSRQTLSLRAELDEKKIELMITRKRLNEEIGELKDRLKLQDEKKLILEEKNRVMLQELDRSSQKNKMDVKKVQIRERELEQRLELLKSDAETQIRHRDLKILELKRKMDAMEFDMESLNLQEKRSVESRFELEDKLGIAIKTLRTAITVLEDDKEHTDTLNALSALKKNIDM